MVLAAVAKDWSALRHAAPALRADEEIMAAAVAKDWHALGLCEEAGQQHVSWLRVGVVNSGVPPHAFLRRQLCSTHH